MPKFSKSTAPRVTTTASSRTAHDDLDGYTIKFIAIREDIDARRC